MERRIGSQTAYGCRAFRRVQSDRNGAFTPVVHVELEVVPAEGALQLGRSAHASHGVAAERFHLDHFCAHVGENGAGTGCCHPVVDFYDANIVERCGHAGMVSVA